MNPVKQGHPLVTGAAGFAGSHLVDRLLESHEQVTAWSNPASRRQPPAAAGLHCDAVDLVDLPAIEQALTTSRPSVIYHCAGIPQVAESWSHADLALRVNAFGTHLLLEAVRRAGLYCPVLVVGSALVYRPSLSALTENNPVGPRDPYGVSKLAQEMVGMRASTPVLIARPFNHAGPRQPSSFVTSSFARQVAEIESGRAEPVLRVGNLDARRDITDVRDIARGYQALATSGRHRVPYNLCSGKTYRVGDLLEMLLTMSRVTVRVEQDPARLRPSDNPVVLGDNARITADTGWCPEIPIERTLSDLLDWWREQLSRDSNFRP
ncbi:GDP-mannose 4,6-dehydratase [soil metagenome]